MSSAGEGTEVQQPHTLGICHWLARPPWSGHFLHPAQCNSTVRELCRFYTTGDTNRVFYNLTCKFYDKQLKPTTIPSKSPKYKNSIGLFPHQKFLFLLWKEVHTQDSTEAIDCKAIKNLLHCDFWDWFLSLKYIFRIVLSYLSCICNQTGEPSYSLVYENTTDFSEMEVAASSTASSKLCCLYHNPSQKYLRAKQTSRFFFTVPYSRNSACKPEGGRGEGR